jgi:hypothetical protein
MQCGENALSLLRPIIRSCAVAALRERTWAESRVFDSDMKVLAEAILGQTAKPYIVVYSEADDRTPAAAGEMYSGIGREMQLAVEIGVASAVRAPSSDDVIIRFSGTDQGLEFACDVIDGQVIAALYGDPDSEWGELLRRFAPRVTKVPSRRGGQGSGTGVKFAARRTVFILSNLIDDLVPGTTVPDAHPVYEFIRMARASGQGDDIMGRANVVEKLISETDPHPSWMVAQAYLGLDRQSTKNINPDGTPLPWGKPGIEIPVEQPPLEEMGEHEWPPVTGEIILVDDDPRELPRAQDLMVSRPRMSWPKVTPR